MTLWTLDARRLCRPGRRPGWLEPLATQHLRRWVVRGAEALRDKYEELADDVWALSALAHAIRMALVSTGLVKDGE